MPILDLAALFGSVEHSLPLAFLGAMFPFFGKPEKPAVSTRTQEAITRAVHGFLEARGVVNFKVYTLIHEDNPVILVQAEPQKKLRFSNILEIQIRKFVQEKLGKEAAAVFWRFKTDNSDVPGPEQADYEFEEQPTYPQDKTVLLNEPTISAETQPGSDQTPSGETEKAENHGMTDELYDVRHSTKQGFEVEEITLGEFDEFLKGSSTKPKPE